MVVYELHGCFVATQEPLSRLRGIALHPSGSFIAAYGPRYLVIWAINEVE